MKFKVGVMIVINIICIFCIVLFCTPFIISSPLGWKKLDFEYVSEVHFTRAAYGATEGTAPPGVFDCIPAVTERNSNSAAGPDFWFYEIRNEDEWKYFCDLLGIEESDYTFDFLHFYVISISRKLTGLKCNNLYWDKSEYGSLVRADFNLEDYEKDKIYIYQLDEDVNFFYNQRDWEMYNFNLDYGQLFILNDEPYEPYLKGVFY